MGYGMDYSFRELNIKVEDYYRKTPLMFITLNKDHLMQDSFRLILLLQLH